MARAQRNARRARLKAHSIHPAPPVEAEIFSVNGRCDYRTQHRSVFNALRRTFPVNQIGNCTPSLESGSARNSRAGVTNPLYDLLDDQLSGTYKSQASRDVEYSPAGVDWMTIETLTPLMPYIVKSSAGATQQGEGTASAD